MPVASAGPNSRVPGNGRKHAQLVSTPGVWVWCVVSVVCGCCVGVVECGVWVWCECGVWVWCECGGCGVSVVSVVWGALSAFLWPLPTHWEISRLWEECLI